MPVLATRAPGPRRPSLVAEALPAEATPQELRYRRVLLKLSGESLMGERPYGVDPDVTRAIAGQLPEAQALGVAIAVVVAGGNIFRGRAAAARGMDRATGDYMGRQATVMNGRALQDALEQVDCPT